MPSSSFKDHFSRQASDYAAYRPWYPAELYSHLATVSARHERAWDCATGNGQAARGLAEYFAHVVATDASLSQLLNRHEHARVDYCASLAEAVPLAAGSCDLVTVAQAVHWFDFERFYAEVRRVLRPGGAIALWTYGGFAIRPDIDRCIDHFYEHVVGAFWPPERRYIEEDYRTIPFPFAELRSPAIVFETTWTLDHLMNYLGTWSAVLRFRDARGTDPLPALRAELEALWGAPEAPYQVSWPLTLRVGRI